MGRLALQRLRVGPIEFIGEAWFPGAVGLGGSRHAHSEWH
jgi:hypothetical protein